MKQYYEVILSPVQSAEAEILISYLGDLDFYAFEIEGLELKAYTDNPVDEG